MDDSALHTDGNAIAGALQEIFVAEMTAVERICQSCGTRSALGAHRAYVTAGTVLRCPACGDIALRMARLPDSHVVELFGTWQIAAS